MTKKIFAIIAMAAIALIPALTATSQGQGQVLAVSGRSGTIPVTQIQGRNYVEVEAFARLTRASLGFNGNQILFTMPSAGDNSQAAPPPPPGQPANTGFSRGFLRAGIEAMSTMREWHTALATAIQNQIPITQEWLTPYQSVVVTNLRLAQAEARTDADQNAIQVMMNVFQKMKQLSDNYVAARANLNYIAPDALRSDPLDQSIVACGKALGAMAGSGQYVDDPACQ